MSLKVLVSRGQVLECEEFSGTECGWCYLPGPEPGHGPRAQGGWHSFQMDRYPPWGWVSSLHTWLWLERGELGLPGTHEMAGLGRGSAWVQFGSFGEVNC